MGNKRESKPEKTNKKTQGTQQKENPENEAKKQTKKGIVKTRRKKQQQHKETWKKNVKEIGRVTIEAKRKGITTTGRRLQTK